MEFCAICSQQINSEVNISAACGHNFHLACLVPYFLTKSLCPSDGCGLVIVREIQVLSETKVCIKRSHLASTCSEELAAKRKSEDPSSLQNVQSTTGEEKENVEARQLTQALLSNIPREFSAGKKFKKPKRPKRDFEINLGSVEGNQIIPITIPRTISDPLFKCEFAVGNFKGNVQVKLVGNALIIHWFNEVEEDGLAYKQHVKLFPPTTNLNSIKATLTGSPPVLTIKAWGF
uniref:RING-type domain-containing protein n=1 Tax=Meloidogyne incognita TaxID=6306 RepID=A0A914L685_MELIC